MANKPLKDALSVVELEDRFEMTVAAVDTARCDDNTVTLSSDATAAQ
jgi:hypothetical protein